MRARRVVWNDMQNAQRFAIDQQSGPDSIRVEHSVEERQRCTTEDVPGPGELEKDGPDSFIDGLTATYLAEEALRRCY
jgi:hypothetical protein